MDGWIDGWMRYRIIILHRSFDELLKAWHVNVDLIGITGMEDKACCKPTVDCKLRRQRYGVCMVTLRYLSTSGAICQHSSTYLFVACCKCRCNSGAHVPKLTTPSCNYSINTGAEITHIQPLTSSFTQTIGHWSPHFQYLNHLKPSLLAAWLSLFLGFLCKITILAYFGMSNPPFWDFPFSPRTRWCFSVEAPPSSNLVPDEWNNRNILE